MVWTASSCWSGNRSALAKMQSQCEKYGFAATPLSQPVDSLLKTGGEPSKVAVIKAAFEVAAALNHSQRFRDAVNWGGDVIPLLSEDVSGGDKDELQYYIYLLDEFGSACNAMGQQSKLCDTYLKALGIARMNGMADEEAILLNNIASVYYSLGDNDRALKHLNEAIAINEKAKNKERLFVNYNNLSGIYVTQGNFDKALEFAFLALHQLNGENNTEMEMLMQRNICSIYRKQGHYDMALDMMRKIIDYQTANGQLRYLTDTYRLMGSIYSDVGDYRQAREYLEKALSADKGSAPVAIKSIILKDLARIQSQQGDYQNAYATMMKYQQLRDSINNAENKSRMEVITNLYDGEQMQLSQISEQSSRLSALTWALVVMAVLLVAAVVLWLRAIRASKRLASNAAAYSDIENDTRLLTERIEELENKMAQKESQMMHLSVLATRDSEFIENLNKSLKDTLLKLNPKSTEARNAIREALSHIANYETSGNINELNEVFNNVYPSFYENLFKEFGDLTPKELRLCALIRLGLSTKSIAAVTFREVRSVESARNRLRKKFGLGHDDNLSQFLRRF